MTCCALYRILHILPAVKQALCCRRRRPFLIKSLENTLSKLLKSLDFYDADARHKVAIGMLPFDAAWKLVGAAFGPQVCKREECSL